MFLASRKSDPQPHELHTDDMCKSYTLFAGNGLIPYKRPGFIAEHPTRNPHLDNVLRRHWYSWISSGFCKWPRCGACGVTFRRKGSSRGVICGCKNYFLGGPSLLFIKPSTPPKDPKQRPFKNDTPFDTRKVLEEKWILWSLLDLVVAWRSDQNTTQKMSKNEAWS